MLFNSIEYLLFFPIVVILYFLIPKNSIRVYLLLIASYFFYMCWNPVYILLIVLSTIVDYFVGREMGRTEEKVKRNILLYISLLANLGILFYFKYYNFIATNLQILIDQINPNWYIPEHSYLLPVGISFYTFQTLSYTLDIYYKKLEPELNFARFALFVSFFPQLVAGPVERAKNLLPQFRIKHELEYERFVLGARMILWGMFKKVVVADRLAIFVDTVFSNPNDFGGFSSILASIFFVFQIYCDFSGYTDIAIGSAKILGFDLMDNFKGPLFSKNMTEFWRRWHISLSTWIRDYVFVPMSLAFRDLGTYSYLLVSFLSFTIFGFWHGANWTYIIWGALHGIAMGYETFTRKKRKRFYKKTNKAIYDFISIILTFTFWTFTMIIFRAETISDAMVVLTNIVSFGQEGYFDLTNFMNYKLFVKQQFLFACALILFTLGVHYLEYKDWLYASIEKRIPFMRWSIYLMLVFFILNFGNTVDVPFVYFQF